MTCLGKVRSVVGCHCEKCYLLNCDKKMLMLKHKTVRTVAFDVMTEVP